MTIWAWLYLAGLAPAALFLARCGLELAYAGKRYCPGAAAKVVAFGAGLVVALVWPYIVPPVLLFVIGRPVLRTRHERDVIAAQRRAEVERLARQYGLPL